MHHSPLHSPGLIIAIALFAGVVAQALARKLALPGIVLLLISGVLLGPDVGGVIDPQYLGEGLHALVGFAVAIILFEGGLALNLRRLIRAAGPIRQLVTLGAVVTAVGGTLVAKYTMGWGWRSSILFGTLVIVTGPTVITPLLRRLKVERGVATVLEAEGVLIDAVGAVIAAVALEVALSPTEANMTAGVIHVGARIGWGALLGMIGGWALSFSISSGLIPGGFSNVYTLAFVLALFQGSNAMLHESGIAAVTVAGIVVGRGHSAVHRQLHDFKEQLTSMLIGMLFILLAADVRIEQVQALGKPGLWTVLLMMFVVRPLNVFIGTWGSPLSVKQKVFMSWIGPRGIIAAAVASIFAVRLGEAGLPGGQSLRALVFMVIAVTVLAAGLFGGVLAKLLGLRRKSNSGWVVLGANELALKIIKVLGAYDDPIICIESNPHKAQVAERAKIKVIFGNALEERTLLRADTESRFGVLCLSSGEETNLLFAEKAISVGKAPRALVALDSLDRGVTENMVVDAGAEVLFGTPQVVDLWSIRLRRKLAKEVRYRFAGESLEIHEFGAEGLVLPMISLREKKANPVSSKTVFKPQDVLVALIFKEREEEAVAKLGTLGFVPVDAPENQEAEEAKEPKEA